MSLLAFFTRFLAKAFFQNSEDKVLRGSYVINGLCIGVHCVYEGAIQILCYLLA